VLGGAAAPPSTPLNASLSLATAGWTKVACGLTACTPGSAPGPTLEGNEWKPLPFYHLDPV